MEKNPEIAQRVFDPKVYDPKVFDTRIRVLWDAASLTFASVLYTAGITITGVMLAAFSWRWRLGYALVSVGLLALGLKFKRAVIRFSRRLIGPLADLERQVGMQKDEQESAT